MEIAPTAAAPMVSPVQRNISAVVRALLKAYGLHQRELCEALHLSDRGVSHRVTNRRLWTPDDLLDLATYFSVPVGIFYRSAVDVQAKLKEAMRSQDWSETEPVRTGRRRNAALSRRFSLVAGGGDRISGRAELCAIQ